MTRSRNTNKSNTDDTPRGVRIDKPIQAVLGGAFLTRKRALRFLPFLFFLTFLTFLYITNIYFGESKQREIEQINEELKELRYEFVSEKSKLMFQSKQSEIAVKLEASGIIESTTPPEKITIQSNEEPFWIK